MKLTISLFCAVAAVLGITMSASLMHARLTNDGAANIDAATVAARLDALPTEFGEWQMQDATPLEDEVLATLRCAGSLNRVYVHQRTGETVHLTLMAGPAGPLSVHTPEICYSSRDYELTAPPAEHAIDSGGARGNFWQMTLRANRPDRDPLEVAYAWNQGVGWVAPKYPRFSLAGAAVLYKIQIAASSGASPGDGKDTVGSRFLIAALPEIEKSLAFSH